MLGIVTALPVEARQLTRAVPSVELPLHIADHIVLAVSGIGPDKAARAAERLVRRDVRLLASVGFAGALDPTLRAGAILLPEAVIGCDGKRYSAESAIHERLASALCRLAPVTVSPLLEVNEVAVHPQAKATLHRRHSAVAIDMESAAVARVARLHGLGFIALRVVLDDAQMHLPARVLASVDPLGRLPLGAGALALIAHPGEALAAARLLRALSRARAALRAAAGCLLRVSQRNANPVARHA